MDDIIKKARDFAIKSHWGQMYGSSPYIIHLEDVSSICKDFDLPIYVQAAAYLHDVVEDTPVHANMISNLFGYDIATLVYAVTDVKSNLTIEKAAEIIFGKKMEYLTEPNTRAAKKYIRREKKLKTYPKILSHPYGVHLKLADRIANLRACAVSKDQNMFETYCEEAREFSERLQTPGIAENMWAELENCYGNKSIKDKIL